MSSATRETFPLNRLLPYGGSNIPFHAKTAREQVSGKLDINIDIAQKYLLEGMEKLIGDCNEPKVFYKTWKLVNCIIALPIANILVGEVTASHEDLVKALGDLAFDLGPLLVIPPILFFIHKKLHEIVVTLPFKFGWSPISRHRNIVKNRLSPVVEKRLKERKELGDNYKPYNDLLEYYMNQPDFDITKPNNLLYHIDNLFAITFASINTTSRASVDALYVTLPHYVISKSYTFSNGFTVPGGRMTMLYTNDMLMAKESFDSLTEVFRNNNDFDMELAAKETLPLERLLPYSGNNVPFHVKATRDQISGKLDINIDIAQKYLLKGIDKLIGDCNEPKVVYNAWNMVNFLIALPIANILVGEEAASHEDLVKSLGDLAFDVGPLLVIPPILFFIHKKLHEIVITLPLKFGWNPVSRHRNVVMNRLRPVVEKRLKERKELGNYYKPYNDLWEYYMNLPNFDNTNPNNLHFHVDNLLAITFASISTTSRAAVDALYGNQ
ncbi:11448_t:CDS:10 [Rhizophagus irregularis]|nr:11448_t:CDS:10 [Rhizophagus irregularis]